MDDIVGGNKSKKMFAKVKLVLFYVPNSDIMVAFNVNDPEFNKMWESIKQKLRRLNNYISGQDDLADELDTGENEEEELSPEDKIENKKEAIKQIVFKDVAKTIHANNLTDFEAASRDERDIMVSIDKKVDEYLKKPENLKKTIPDLIADVQADNDVKAKAIRYIETKKASVIRNDILAKGMTKETEIIGSL